MSFLRKIRRVYFDHAAATPTDPRVLKAMELYWSLDYANPSAIHKEGVFARKAVEEARESIAALLGVHTNEIVFTGSATESANLAIFGAVHAWQKTHPGRTAHIIVSAIEHDAVLEPARRLEEEGVRVTRLPIDPRGIVDPVVLRNALDLDTVLLSVMYANNEIGTIQPLPGIAKIIRKWKKEMRGVTRIGKPEGDEHYPLFHTDATQAVNYCDMHIPRLGIDMLTLNAAKVYGPKGIGLLFVLRDTPMSPIILGGGHEGNRRAGTENVPGIIGCAEALRVAREMTERESGRLSLIRNYAINELKKFPGLVVNGDEQERLPNNVNFSMLDTDHEFLVLQLDAKGFAVATKSACNESDAETSHVLAALRKADGTSGAQSGIRLSFGRETKKEHIKQFIQTLNEIRRMPGTSP